MSSARPLDILASRRSATARLVMRSLRCWRLARDEGAAPQPRLFRILERPEWVVLAPVMDSLFRFYEAALGRRLAMGGPGRISGDEGLLLDFITLSRPSADRIDCDPTLARTLDCALRSAKVMLELAAPKPASSS